MLRNGRSLTIFKHSKFVVCLTQSVAYPGGALGAAATVKGFTCEKIIRVPLGNIFVTKFIAGDEEGFLKKRISPQFTRRSV